MSVLPMSFTTEPCPRGPQRMAFAPITMRTGISSSKTSCLPPHMRRSVPLSAPVFDPVTGASSTVAPLRSRTSATRFMRPGEMVEVSM